VILPTAWPTWPQNRLDAILAHEGEHVRRRDPLVQWLALLNRALFWFHPLAWWLQRHIARLAEEACDAAVLANGNDPITYAEALLQCEAAAALAGGPVQTFGVAMPGSALPQRIEHILAGSHDRPPSRGRLVWAGLISIMAATLFVAVVPAQAPPTGGPLEVASVKPNNAGGNPENKLPAKPTAEEIRPKLDAPVHGDSVQVTLEPKEITIAPQILAQYVGTYELAPGHSMMITLDGDQLMAHFNGPGKIPLFAESETAFSTKVVSIQEVRIAFSKDGQGKVTQLVLSQNGYDGKAVRTSDTAERREFASWSTPAILAAYVGTYELGPGFDLVIMLEGSQLMAQATGQPKYPLFAEGPGNFFLKAVDAQVDFGKDQTGDVTSLVLHQGGRSLKGTRQ
jgi:hypothetical protein